MIPEGKYLAKAVGGKYGLSNEKKTPGVALTLEFKVGDKVERLVWKGWFSEKTTERTIETLAIMGFDEFKSVQTDGSFGPENFDNSEVDITVEHESFVGSDGQPKVAPKIKWINKPGGTGFGFAENVEVKTVLAGIDLKKELMVARQKLGIKKSASKPVVKNHAPGFDSDETLPF